MSGDDPTPRGHSRGASPFPTRATKERPSAQTEPRGDPLDILDDRRAAYAARWSSQNAAAFEAGGHYAWMADHAPITEYPHLLEIGMGDCRATDLLLARNRL